jgi:hypothetical protein
VLNRFEYIRCEQKNVKANEIAGFGDLEFFILPLE